MAVYWEDDYDNVANLIISIINKIPSKNVTSKDKLFTEIKKDLEQLLCQCLILKNNFEEFDVEENDLEHDIDKLKDKVSDLEDEISDLNIELERSYSHKLHVGSLEDHYKRKILSNLYDRLSLVQLEEFIKSHPNCNFDLY